MQTKLKVLHVIPSVSPTRGGPTTAVIEMVNALRASNIDAEIATTNDHGDDTLDVPLNELTQFNGVPVRFFKRFSPAINSVREFAYSNDFRTWIKKHISNYDLIHVHAIFSFCSTYAMYQARTQGVPYTVHLLGQLEGWSLTQSDLRKKAYLNLIERQNLISANTIQFTAKSEKKQALEAIPALNGTVIPLGIYMPEVIDDAAQKMRSHWSLKEDIPTLIFLSRLHPKKGLEHLIASLAQLNNRHFQLLIAGDGDSQYKDSLKATIAKHGLSDQCRLIGFVAGYEKDLLLQGADLFTLTSHSENFGIVALEAMAAKTAVLMSKEVALSEYVEQHKLGYTTSLDEKDITKTLHKALSQLDATRNKGNNGYHFVKSHFQWSAISEKLIKMYQSII